MRVKRHWSLAVVNRAALAACLAACVAACLAGCSSSSGAMTGNLGNGTFSYGCVDVSDNACANQPTAQTTAATFPAAVAVGSRFRLTFEPGSNAGNVGNPVLSAISPDFVARTGDGFTALQPGFGGVVARSSIDGKVVDYTLVPMSTIQSMRIDAAGGQTVATLSLRVGATATVRVTPLDSTGSALAGSLDATWASTDATHARVDASPSSGHATITGVAAGTATVNVTSGALTAPVVVTVGG